MALGVLNALPTFAGMKETLPHVCEQRSATVNRADETETLRRLFDDHHGAIYALCFRMLGHEQDAQDALQSTFIRAFQGLASFRGDSQLKTWLYRIAVNESVAILRKRRTGQTELHENICTRDNTGLLAEKLSVEQALLKISADHRAILVLRFWQELSYEEIANVLEISLSAAKMRLQRARVEFKKWYEEADR